MRHQHDRLSPDERRSLVADLLARRLMDLASRGLLVPIEVEPRPAAPGSERGPLEEAVDGPR